MKHPRDKRDGLGRRFGRRLALVVALFGAAGMALVGRSVQLQLLDQDFLARQADARHLRTAIVSAHRGTIKDRNGEPLAVSTPVDSIWVNPGELIQASDRLPDLARALGQDADWLTRRITRNSGREFVYLVRHLPPHRAEQVLALDVPGVYSQREYRRYYPAGEVAAHVVGFTDRDDSGLEGLELAYDPWLAGVPGAKRVLRDRLGRTIEDVESIRPPRAGQDLVTSLDLRIQYAAYRALKRGIAQHRAKAGSVVVLDVQTGEVLAMVNQPGFNPNDRARFPAGHYRNQAATDIFEPGSSFKPFIIAAALDSGRYGADAVIDTSPGRFTVGRKTIEDKHNLGRIPITTVLTKSSNVGASRIALSLDPPQLWGVLDGLGFGHLTESGFPGESAGIMTHHENWREIGQATMAYGYGLSVTPVQLAHAYAVLGAGGISLPVSMKRVDAAPAGRRVLSERSAREVVAMMETVVSTEGTALKAAIPGYRVAGKTGTAWKATAGGYASNRYTSVFGGLVPASAPRLAVVVVVHEPAAGVYYAGDVAAPVFSEVAGSALRVLGVPPDDAANALAPEQVIQAMSGR